MRTRWEAGFTLVEVVIVTGIIALVAGTAGTFFLAGATPAVASASRDVIAAFDEGRRTAIAFDSAAVVFAPAIAGSGYRARVYARVPGDADFRVRNGPAYESTVAIAETAAPLGAPGFAFTIDSHGSVAALAHYAPNGSAGVATACPAAGAFILHLSYVRDVRDVTIPCRLDASSVLPVVVATPAPGSVPAPVAAQTCPGTENCLLAALPPPGLPTCPPNSSGTFPNCVILLPTPPPQPPPPPPTPTSGASSPVTPPAAAPTPPPDFGGGQTNASAAGSCAAAGAAESGQLYDCSISGGDAPQFFVVAASQTVSLDATGELLDRNNNAIFVVGPVGYVFDVWKVGTAGFVYAASSASDPEYVPGNGWENVAVLNVEPGTYGYAMSATCDTGFIGNDVHWCGAPIAGNGRPILNPYAGSWQGGYQFQ